MSRIIIFSLLGLLIIVAVGGSYYAHVGLGTPISTSGEDWGQFGDYFGGVAGSLLSFLSIILLVYTIHVQSVQISNSQHELLKRDLLAHVTKADEEIMHWLTRRIPILNSSSETVELGDVVWGIFDTAHVNEKEFNIAIIRLHKLICLYCESLALYRDNIDSYFIFRYHMQKAQTLLDFLKKNRTLLGQMAGPSLDFCQMHLDERHES